LDGAAALAPPRFANIGRARSQGQREGVVERFLHFVDRLSMWMGQTFAWCILILTFGVSYEVFVRYVLYAPTAWAFDLSYTMYGALFMMAGAYTLSRNGHVRGDFLYRLLPVWVQGAIDLVLFLFFFFPAVIALIWYGWPYFVQSWSFQETSVFSPASVPVFQIKALIPIAGVVLLLQGISEVVRCYRCIRTGQWPPRLQDVEETESAILHLHEDEAKLHPEAHGRMPQQGTHQ
jgi:TRAP-type mannitol/chloroaromatic compound transport system permease small subunit